MKKTEIVFLVGALALPASLLASASFEADQKTVEKKVKSDDTKKKVAKGGDDKGHKADAKTAKAKGGDKDKGHKTDAKTAVGKGKD